MGYHFSEKSYGSGFREENTDWSWIKPSSNVIVTAGYTSRELRGDIWSGDIHFRAMRVLMVLEIAETYEFPQGESVTREDKKCMWSSPVLLGITIVQDGEPVKENKKIEPIKEDVVSMTKVYQKPSWMLNPTKCW